MEERVHQALAAAGYGDITLAQSKVLQRVWRTHLLSWHLPGSIGRKAYLRNAGASTI